MATNTKSVTTPTDTSGTTPTEDVGVSTMSLEPQQTQSNYQQSNSNTRMATTNAVTDKKLVLGGEQTMILTPYVNGVLSTTTHYELLDIVENTTALTKEEGTETTILNEQGGVIKALYTAGTRTFTANTGDLQEAILKGLFGFKKAKDGRLIEPSSLPEIMVQIKVVFAGGNAEMVCPKVQLNPSITIESLREGIAQGVITGLAQDVTEDVVMEDDSTESMKYSFSIKPLTTP